MMASKIILKNLPVLMNVKTLLKEHNLIFTPQIQFFAELSKNSKS